LEPCGDFRHSSGETLEPIGIFPQPRGETPEPCGVFPQRNLFSFIRVNP
jgi:hypothetical protein